MDQDSHSRFMTFRRRTVQRSFFSFAIARVDVSALVEQESRSLGVPFGGCIVQRRRPLFVAQVDIGSASEQPVSE